MLFYSAKQIVIFALKNKTNNNNKTNNKQTTQTNKDKILAPKFTNRFIQ